MVALVLAARPSLSRLRRSAVNLGRFSGTSQVAPRSLLAEIKKIQRKTVGTLLGVVCRRSVRRPSSESSVLIL